MIRILNKKIAFFIDKVFTLFAFLGIVFIPFPFSLLIFQHDLTKFLFEDIVILLIHYFGLNFNHQLLFTSDSMTLYVLAIILMVLALVLAFTLIKVKHLKKHQIMFFGFFEKVIVYYLSVIMLKYGFDKLFKTQFYKPEPNILFTPLGQLDKDILYWSTIGSSYSYNVFLGLLEIIPACMLLFIRTRILGAFILSGVLAHVVMVNFAYDISVKLFSIFLLMLSLLILKPAFKDLHRFFILKELTILKSFDTLKIIPNPLVYKTLKYGFIGFVCFESLYPYFKSNVFNGDKKVKYELYGAYEVIDNKDIKHLFFHKDNYLILQLQKDSFIDYYIEMIFDNEIILKDYNNKIILFKCKNYANDSMLILENEKIRLKCLKIDLEELPLSKPLFHWTVDEL